MIKLSIIIPIYNGEKFILRALDSIPKRDDIEVICVDDGSTDNTFEILKNYTRIPIKIFHLNKNMGIGYATNTGIEASTGEYITGLDIDDYYITEIFNNCLDNIILEDDIYNFSYLQNSGEVWWAKDIWGLPGKWIKKSFIGNIRWRRDRFATDMYFLQELRRKKPKEKFLNIIYYRYNYPREGSMDWERVHGKAG